MRYWLCLLTMGLLCLPAWADDDLKDEPPEPEGKVRLTLETGGHTSLIRKVLFTPDSSQLITVAFDQTIRIWDIDTGDCVSVLYPPLLIHPHTARLSPDGRRLAVSRQVTDKGTKTFSILLIALPEGRIERVLTGPITSASLLAFSPDGKRLASVSGNKTICLWNLDKEGVEPEKTFATPGAPRGLAFSPDGTHLAQSGEWSGVLDVDGGKEVHKFFAGVAGDDVTWSPDGKTIAFATAHGLRLYDPDGKQRLVLEEKVRISSASFSADSQTVLATEFAPPDGAKRARTFLYGIGGGKALKVFTGEPPGRKPADPRKPPPAPAHPMDESLHDGALSPDGKLAAAVGRLRGQHQVLVWHTSDAQLVRRLSSRAWYNVPDPSLSWSPNGKALIWKDHKEAAHGFVLEDTAQQEGLRLVAKPPAPAPALATEQGGLHFTVPNGENTLSIYRANQSKAVATIKTRGHLWHATFFGKGQVALHGSPFQVMDANTGKQVRVLSGHSSYVLDIACTANQKYLASASWDQVICVHKAGDIAPLLSLYIAGKEWIVWTPEGYYAASPGGEQLMGWVVESNPDEMCLFHPASHFRARLYRPDVIRLLLKESSLARALKKADEARGKDSKVADVSAILPPEVTVTTDARDGKLTIKAEAQARGDDPITALQLLIDDRPYTGERGLIVLDKPQKGPVKVSWEVMLPPGQHAVRVLARTEASLGTSRGLVRELEPEKQKARPALYVLAIGINDYQKTRKLAAAVGDATELEKVLQEHRSPVFGKYESRILPDEKATKKGILEDGFDWLKKRQTSADVAVIFFAGHGDLDKGEFYLVPQDADPNDLAKTGLSRAEIKKRLQGLPGRIVLVLDACHAGAIGLLFDDVSRELTDEDCGVVVMCAASPKESAQEKKHGHLTLAVMEGLSGKAGKRSDGYVYLHHLQPYIIDRVLDLSEEKQHPTTIVPPWMRPFSLSKP
jgi:WD40 repeat protein